MTSQRKHDEPARVYLPITPFLDLAFQLLFFFIVVFKPPTPASQAAEGELQLGRIEQQKTVRPGEPVVAERNGPVDIKLDITVRVIAYKNVPRLKGQVMEVIIEDRNGTLARTDKPGAAPRQCRYKVAADGAWKKQCKEDLESFKPKADKNVAPTLTMQVESDMQWDQIVMVMDLCHKAGFRINFAQPIGDIG